MRLIHAQTYELFEYFAGDAPTYAILSHTWGNDEVTYHDIKDLDPGVRAKQGFLKIRYACLQATADKIDYVWVDTCCIDKSSSAELSEAINSMYQWYREAEVCYVFLEDFPEESTRIIEKTSAGNVMVPDYALFPACRWFTRGWTLQELLAPPLVEFYAAGWGSIGSIGIGRDKAASAALTNAINMATGIHDDYLTHRLPLEDASVATRMSWAARRQCTRVEDTAYCLLGLFGISMPLLYGEGKKAFQRLQEEIWRETDDHSLLAWAVAPGDPRAWSLCSVFAESPVDFLDAGSVMRMGEERGEPSSMTKMGLKLDLLSQPRQFPNTSYLYTHATHLLLLNCSLGGRQLAMLTLLDKSDGPFRRPYTLFTRIATPSLIQKRKDSKERAKLEKMPLETVIVRKNVTSRRRAVLRIDPGHAEVMLHEIPLGDFDVSSYFVDRESDGTLHNWGRQTITIQGPYDGFQPLTYLECLLAPKQAAAKAEIIVLSCVIGMPGAGDGGAAARWKIALAFSTFNYRDGTYSFHPGVDRYMGTLRLGWDYRDTPTAARPVPSAPDVLIMSCPTLEPVGGVDIDIPSFHRFRRDLSTRFGQIPSRDADVSGLLAEAMVEVQGRLLKAKLYRDMDMKMNASRPEDRHLFVIVLDYEPEKKDAATEGAATGEAEAAESEAEESEEGAKVEESAQPFSREAPSIRWGDNVSDQLWEVENPKGYV
ncbi:hypothetical protein ACHAQA_004602 [Verticillium albo-atrum]